jgi:Ca-activated chloride channel family protein
VFARRPVIVFGKWRGPRSGTIALTGISGRGRFVDSVRVEEADASADRATLAQLWARTRIAALSDFETGDAHRAEVTKLGLRYSLLTRYTSFIAVYEKVRSDGSSVAVEQPLPIPAGVSDAAIGMTSGAEPPLAILAGAAFLIAMAWQWRRRLRGAA